MITILLVDSQPSARLGLRMRLALERDMTVVGETETSAGAPALVTAMHPDVVVIDTATADKDGLTSGAALRQIAGHSRVVVLSLRDDPFTQRRALADGATAFVSKWEAHDTLLGVIRRVARPRSERSA
jgi:DNA-binding NarL/FixJ family response regulator